MKTTMAWLSGVSFGVFFSTIMWYQNWSVVGASLVLGILLAGISKITEIKKEVKKGG